MLQRRAFQRLPTREEPEDVFCTWSRFPERQAGQAFWFPRDLLRLMGALGLPRRRPPLLPIRWSARRVCDCPLFSEKFHYANDFLWMKLVGE
jgi:hypothetical protein